MAVNLSLYAPECLWAYQFMGVCKELPMPQAYFAALQPPLSYFMCIRKFQHTEKREDPSGIQGTNKLISAISEVAGSI